MGYPEYTDLSRLPKPPWPAQRRFINWLCEKHGIGSDWKIPEVNTRVYLNIHVNEIIGLLGSEVKLGEIKNAKR